MSASGIARLLGRSAVSATQYFRTISYTRQHVPRRLYSSNIIRVPGFCDKSSVALPCTQAAIRHSDRGHRAFSDDSDASPFSVSFLRTRPSTSGEGSGDGTPAPKQKMEFRKLDALTNPEAHIPKPERVVKSIPSLLGKDHHDPDAAGRIEEEEEEQPKEDTQRSSSAGPSEYALEQERMRMRMQMRVRTSKMMEEEEEASKAGADKGLGPNKVSKQPTSRKMRRQSKMEAIREEARIAAEAVGASWKVNDDIKIDRESEVRVTYDDGRTELWKLSKVFAIAESKGQDVVMVNEEPPVVKIFNLEAFREKTRLEHLRQRQEAARENKTNHVKFNIHMEKVDLDERYSRLDRLLLKGRRVQVSVLAKNGAISTKSGDEAKEMMNAICKRYEQLSAFNEEDLTRKRWHSTGVIYQQNLSPKKSAIAQAKQQLELSTETGPHLTEKQKLKLERRKDRMASKRVAEEEGTHDDEMGLAGQQSATAEATRGHEQGAANLDLHAAVGDDGWVSAPTPKRQTETSTPKSSNTMDTMLQEYLDPDEIMAMSNKQKKDAVKRIEKGRHPLTGKKLKGR